MSGTPTWRRHAPALAAALAFGVVASGGETGLALHFLVGKLVYSTSDAASLFFLGYLAVALAVLAHTSATTQVGTGRRPAWVLTACLLLGHAANLGASLAYYQDHDLPRDAHVHHWLGMDNSYTSLLHSHLGKPALAHGARALGLSPGSYDTGAALSGEAMPALGLLIGLAFLAGLLASLAVLPGLADRHGRRPLVVGLYLVCVAICLKTLLDGGPLSYRVLPSALVLGSLLFAHTPAALDAFWRGFGWRLAFVSLAAYLLLWLQLSAERPIPAVGGLLFTLGTYGLLLTAALGRWRWWPALPVMLYLAVNLTADARQNLMPLLQAFGPDHRLALLDASGRVSQPASRHLSGLPMWRVYRALGESPLKPRRLLVWRADQTGSHTLACHLRLLSTDGPHGTLRPTEALRPALLERTPGGAVRLVAAASPELAPVLVHGDGDALSRANYYVYLHALNGLLQAAGWREYILIPHTASNPAMG